MGVISVHSTCWSCEPFTDRPPKQSEANPAGFVLAWSQASETWGIRPWSRVGQDPWMPMPPDYAPKKERSAGDE